MSQDVDNFLLGSSAKSAKLENIGDSITGTICEQPEMRQQTDMKTGKPETWDDGNPKMQLVVTLQTDQRDTGDPDDEGKRRVYIKGSKKAGTKSMHDAVATAIRAAGVKGIQVGGTLAIAYVGDRPSETRGYNDAKQYEATYAPPSVGLDQPPAPNGNTPPF